MAEPGTWTPTHPAIRAYAITTAVLAALFLILLVLYIGALQRNRVASPDAHSLGTTESNGQTAQDARATSGIPAEPAIVLTRTGTIVRVTRDEIAFTATMFDSAKGAYVETEMTALTGDTLYTELDKTKNAPPIPGQPSLASKETTIRRESLKPGDKIQVFAATNIQGLRRFPVTEVRRLLLY